MTNTNNTPDHRIISQNSQGFYINHKKKIFSIIKSFFTPKMSSRKRTRTNKANVVTVYTRVKEHPDVFRVENNLLFCNYCDLSVEWRHKSTVDSHCLGKKHLAQKKIYEDNRNRSSQQTLETTLLAADSKREVVENLIQAFASANIPLEKINFLLPFFKKYLKEGGTIPQAPTLRQLYLPSVFEKHVKNLSSIFNSKPVCIIMDEFSDDCARSVVNTLFTYRENTKLVSVDFLQRVNNTTIGQTLLPILHSYNISLNIPRLFFSDSAAYMKKCFRDVLKPVMPQLVHVPCLAHILNLIG